MTAAATTPASGPSSPTGLRVGEPPEPPRGDPHRPHVPLDRPADDLLEAASRQRMNIAPVPRSARTSPTTLQIAEPPETPCDYPQPHRSPAALRIAEPPEPPARTADHPADDLPKAATCLGTNAPVLPDLRRPGHRLMAPLISRRALLISRGPRPTALGPTADGARPTPSSLPASPMRNVATRPHSIFRRFESEYIYEFALASTPAL